MSTNLPGEDGGSFPIAPSTVGGATSTRPGSLQITQTSFSACRAQYPGGLDQVHLLVSSLPMQPPRLIGGSASTTKLSRPAQASLALRPAELLAHPTWALSQGFIAAVSLLRCSSATRSNQHLSGRVLPSLVISAVGAHYKMGSTLLPLPRTRASKARQSERAGPDKSFAGSCLAEHLSKETLNFAEDTFVCFPCLILISGELLFFCRGRWS